MIDNSVKFNNALLFARQKHKGQFRRGGKEYITHPVAVSEILRQKGFEEDYLIAGLFHDLLEDTDATEEEILKLGGLSVLNSVKLVTKKDGFSHKEYIAGIKKDPMAFAVKGADRLHNLLSAVEADEDFRRRYIKDTVEWYYDFGDDIIHAVKNLAETLSSPMTEYPFLYE